MNTKLFLIPAALFFAACKTSPQVAQTKSLDNFTGASVVVNNCSGANAALVPDGALTGPDTASVQAALDALTAVPEALQKEFFTTMHGKIEIGALPASCQTVGKASAQTLDSDMISCFQEANGAVTIHIAEAGADTPRNVSHALVRMFGYVTSEIMLPYPKAAGELPVDPAHLTTLRADLLGLAKQDLANAGKSDLADKLDDGVLANMFAETFDSHYCSAASKAALQASFPLAAAKFASDFADQLDEALTVDAAPATGLSLWGRWGFGNGPLRQAFSNWLDYRADGGGLFNVRRWADGGGLVFQQPWFNPFQWDTIQVGGGYTYQPSYETTYYYYP